MPVNTAEPLISGSPVEGIDAQHHDRHVGRHVDHVRVPVGALRHERRAPGRLELPDDPRGDELQLHARRPTTSGVGSASRSRRRTPRARQPRRRTPPTSVTAVAGDRPAAQHRRAVDQRHARAVGSVLFASVGTWAGVTPITYSTSGFAAARTAEAPTDPTATSSRARRRPATSRRATDVGQRLRFSVTATNSLGVQTVASNAIRGGPGGRRPRRRRHRATRSCPSSRHDGGRPDALRERRRLERHVADRLRIRVAAMRNRRRHVDGSGCAPSPARRTRSTPCRPPTSAGACASRVTARNTLGTANATRTRPRRCRHARAGRRPTPTPDPRELPPGAVQLPGGKVLDPRHERLAARAPGRRRDRLRCRTRCARASSRSCSVSGSSTRAAMQCVTRSSSLARRRSSRPRPARCGRAATAGRGSSLTPHADFPLDGRSVQFMDPGAQAVGPAARGRLEPEARPGRNGAAERRALTSASGRRGPARSLRERSLRYPWIEAMIGISRIATMFAILIIGLIAGPAVSL